MSAHADRLCYLEASKVLGPTGDLGALDVRTEHGEHVGVVDGVLIDAVAQKLRYFVVDTGGWMHRRCLLPLDGSARVERDHNTLRLAMDAADLSGCEEFDTTTVREYTEEDAIAPTLIRHLA